MNSIFFQGSITLYITQCEIHSEVAFFFYHAYTISRDIFQKIKQLKVYKVSHEIVKKQNANSKLNKCFVSTENDKE